MKKLKKKKQQFLAILFNSETKIGKSFDIILLFLILLSVVTVVVESVGEYALKYGSLFFGLELIFSLIFSLEYILRLMSAKKALNYAKSYYGIIDLVSILPIYISFFFSGTGSFLVIRGLRILRVFRIFKLTKYLTQGHQIVEALKRSRPKITVFFVFVLLLVTIIGSLMYLVEAKSNPDFDNIPRSVYWAIVTLTTVGYGDITPNSPMGQGLASVVMILGYSVIAVPTGIITSELNQQARRKYSAQICASCFHEAHDSDASYCKKCGKNLKK